MVGVFDFYGGPHAFSDTGFFFPLYSANTIPVTMANAPKSATQVTCSSNTITAVMIVINGIE